MVSIEEGWPTADTGNSNAQKTTMAGKQQGRMDRQKNERMIRLMKCPNYPLSEDWQTLFGFIFNDLSREIGWLPECLPGVAEYKAKATVCLSGLVGRFPILILRSKQRYPMRGYRYFTEQGNQYSMKRRYGYALIISIIFALCGFGGYVAHMPVVMWMAAGVTVLFLVSIGRESTVIDLTQREMVLTKGLLARKTIVPLDAILHFEMVRVTHTLITVNTSLNVWYSRDGKEKVAMVSNGITRRAMQNLLNEIEEILKHAGHPATV
jgi:hypothetical protein